MRRKREEVSLSRDLLHFLHIYFTDFSRTEPKIHSVLFVHFVQIGSASNVCWVLVSMSACVIYIYVCMCVAGIAKPECTMRGRKRENGRTV